MNEATTYKTTHEHLQIAQINVDNNAKLLKELILSLENFKVHKIAHIAL